MEIDSVCKEIPIELWEIIAKLSSSSVKCIMRHLCKYFKSMIETKFASHEYIIYPTELLSKASKEMISWCIKCSFSIEKLALKRIGFLFEILISKDDLHRIKQLHELSPLKYYEHDVILSGCLTGHSEIIKYLVEEKCLSPIIISLLIEDAVEKDHLDILQYLDGKYKIPERRLVMYACITAFHGHYLTLKYFLKKGCRDPEICLYALEGGSIDCFRLAYKRGCITSKSDFQHVYSYMIKYDDTKKEQKTAREIAIDICYQYMKRIMLLYDSKASDDVYPISPVDFDH